MIRLVLFCLLLLLGCARKDSDRAASISALPRILRNQAAIEDGPGFSPRELERISPNTSPSRGLSVASGLHWGWGGAFGANQQSYEVGTYSSNNAGVARYTASGGVDTSFSLDGLATFTFSTDLPGANSLHGAAVQSDGRVVVAGRTATSSQYQMALGRLHTNGTLDTSFATVGWLAKTLGTFGTFGKDVRLDADGRSVVATVYGSLEGGSRFGLLRFLSSGAIDTSFNTTGFVAFSLPSGFAQAYRIILQTSGHITAVGNGLNATTSKYNVLVARFQSDGTLDTSFGTVGWILTPYASANEYGMGISTSGVGGYYLSGGTGILNARGALLVRLHSDGSLDTSFSSDGFTRMTFSTYPWESRGVYANSTNRPLLSLQGLRIASSYVARLTTNGNLDTLFNTTGSQVFNACSVGFLADSTGQYAMAPCNGSYHYIGAPALVNWTHGAYHNNLIRQINYNTDTTLTLTNYGYEESATNMAEGSPALAGVFDYAGGTYPGGGNCGATLGVGSSCTVIVRYRPTVIGTTSNQALVVDYDHTLNTSAATDLPLRVTGGTTSITITPGGSFDYGTVLVGGPGYQSSFTATSNDAVCTATASVADPRFSVSGGNCSSAEIASGNSCTASVMFTPVAVTSYTDILTLTCAEAGSFTKNLAGAGGSSVSPAWNNPDNFVKVSNGSTKPVTYTLTNSGDASATGLTLSIDTSLGVVHGWTISSTTCTSTLAGSANCTATVSMAAADTSTNDTPTLVADYAEGADATRALSGTGDTVTTLSISDPGYDFGAICPTGTPNKEFTVTNDDADAYLSGLTGSLPAGQFSFTGGTYPGTGATCGTTLAGAGTCTVKVTFTASASDTKTLNMSGAGGVSSDRAIIGTSDGNVCDADNDGDTVGEGDCNESNAAIGPSQTEICGDATDQDCTGGNNNGCTDGDSDSYYTTGVGSLDCDDNSAGVNPGAAEVCGDGIDQDCTGGNNNGCTDADGDGYYTTGVDPDCDDNDINVYPGNGCRRRQR